MRAALFVCWVSAGCLWSCSDLQLVVAEVQGDGGTNNDARSEATVGEGGVRPCAGGVGSFAVGDDHLCIANRSGELFCAGQNSSGQLGNGGTDYSTVRVRAELSTAVVSVEAGDDHTCALGSTGALYCWGRNDRNQLGDGSNIDALTPKRIADGPFAALSVGFNSTCALDTQRALYCWGANDFGALGTGDVSDRATPTLVDDGPWSDVSVGEFHACAIKSGSLYCWGDNSASQLGIPGADMLALPTLVGTGWRTVSAGERHSCAISQDGSLYCWGDNADYRLGLGDANDREAPTEVGGLWSDVVAARHHSCGIRDGAVECWGSGPVIGGESVDAVSTTPTAILFEGAALQAERLEGTDEIACAATDSYIVCWGENNNGELGQGVLSELEPPLVACP